MAEKEFLKIWKTVFSNWKYTFLAFVIALFFYTVNALISNVRGVIAFYHSFGFISATSFFITLLIGFKSTIKTHTFFSLIIISILLGMLVSLILYKVRLGMGNGGKKVGFLGGLGVFLAAFVPGCAACGVGLASLLGISAGFLSLLPYEGLELSIISVLLLGYTIIKVSNDMYTCSISRKHLEKMKGGRV